MDTTTGNDKQGTSNTDTVIKLYAVQTGGNKPIVAPYPGTDASF
jgi:hypothetical protein